LLRSFLFNGIDELGSRTFLDYFPEYRCEDGAINEKRSIVGKSFENRPWDTRGEFIDKNS
jgi:phytochromobilin:ferredoxin oxidoreductase